MSNAEQDISYNKNKDKITQRELVPDIVDRVRSARDLDIKSQFNIKYENGDFIPINSTTTLLYPSSNRLTSLLKSLLNSTSLDLYTKSKLDYIDIMYVENIDKNFCIIIDTDDRYQNTLNLAKVIEIDTGNDITSLFTYIDLDYFDDDEEWLKLIAKYLNIEYDNVDDLWDLDLLHYKIYALNNDTPYINSNGLLLFWESPLNRSVEDAMLERYKLD